MLRLIFQVCECVCVIVDMSTFAQETLSFSPDCRLREVNTKDVTDMIANVGNHLDKMDKLVTASEAKEKETIKKAEVLLEEADRLLQCARPLATSSLQLSGTPVGRGADRENTSPMLTVAETQLDADADICEPDEVMISPDEVVISPDKKVEDEDNADLGPATVPVPKNSRRKQLALSSEADPGCAKGPPVKKTKAKAKAKTVNKTPKEKIAPKKVTQEEKKRCPKVPNKNGKKDSEDQDSKDDHQGKDHQETHALAKKPKKNATAKAKARNLREPRAGKGELKRPAASKERGSKKAHGSANSKEDAEVTIKKKMHSAPWQTIV